MTYADETRAGEAEHELRDDWRPDSKGRLAAQRAATKLFDALAPERPPARGAVTTPELQRVRSPRGCILQLPECAVTASWFPPGAHDASLGELIVIAWKGTVSRPGAAPASARAQAMREIILRPTELGAEWGWKSADGDEVYGCAELAARCERWLEEARTA